MSRAGIDFMEIVKEFLQKRLYADTIALSAKEWNFDLMPYCEWSNYDRKSPLIVEFNQEDVNSAISIAKRKEIHVGIHSPDGRVRSPTERLLRIIAGKLADYAVKHAIVSYAEAKKIGCQILEYDEIRDDDFEQPDPWDLLSRVSSKNDIEIEVRSSFVHMLRSFDRVFDNPKQSLIGPYKSDHKPAERAKDLFWQVSFLRTPSVPTPKEFVNPLFFGDLRDLPLRAAIMGGGERSLFETIGKTRFISGDAEYRVISPMKDGRSVEQMCRLATGQLETSN